MLISDLRTIGNKLLALRKHSGLTQYEVAEAAGLSGRTYADIERGTVSMRVDTLIRICNALHITPDEILTQNEADVTAQQMEVLEKLDACAPKKKANALRLLNVFLQFTD